jgi:hypothetical protein
MFDCLDNMKNGTDGFASLYFVLFAAGFPPLYTS